MPYKDPEKRREALKRWYGRHKQEQMCRVKNNSKKNRQKVYDYKESIPCTDCGVYYPHYVMEFDHVRGEKEGHVANMLNRNFSNRKVWAEIEKCELVCANCHRCRTHARRQQNNDDAV